MAETNEEQSGVNWNVICGIGVLIFGSVVSYWYLTKDNKPKEELEKGEPEQKEVKEEKQNVPAPVVESKPETTTATTSTSSPVSSPVTSGAKVSPIRTDHDNAYNYQKRNGVWFSAKKSAPTVWASWAVDSAFAKKSPAGWKAAVADLNSRYPND